MLVAGSHLYRLHGGDFHFRLGLARLAVRLFLLADFLHPYSLWLVPKLTVKLCSKSIQRLLPLVFLSLFARPLLLVPPGFYLLQRVFDRPAKSYLLFVTDGSVLFKVEAVE